VDLTACCQITAILNVKTAERKTSRAIKRITASKSCHLDSCAGSAAALKGKENTGDSKQSLELGKE